MMKRLAISLSIGALAAVGVVAVASAADPSPSPAAPAAADPTPTPTAVATPPPAFGPPEIRGPETGTLSGILGMSQDEIDELRAQGQTLAQIAQAKGIDPQRLIDALVAVWGARIDARAAAGALTAEQADALKANLAVQAKAMVNQEALGGMRGGAVGAGPGAMGGGMGRWSTDDTTGAQRGMGGGMGRWSTDDTTGAQRGMGRWGTGDGAGADGCQMTDDLTDAS